MKLLAAFLVLVPLAFGEMHQVWEVRLGNKIKEPPGWGTLKRRELQDIAFSPDGKLLAVTIDDHAGPATIGTHVLVMDVATPAADIRQYDVGTCGAPLEWSPGGDAILVCGYVLRFPGGTACSTIEPRSANLPPLFPIFRDQLSHEFWRDSTHIVQIELDGASVLDKDCHKQPATREEILDLERASRKMPSGWPPEALQDYIVVSASRDRLRVLVEHHGFSSLHHIDLLAQLTDDPKPVDRRLVWDVGTAREIAAWKPFKQPYSPAVTVHPYRNCALSSDGQFVAEGGDGVVRLYRLD
ncbi:MAG TPA: hypothetical protein VN841_18805 [Bryobacteraceae bacterium]|nr:hypothetical protein [Bryobacteraceae bacterium]